MAKKINARDQQLPRKGKALDPENPMSPPRAMRRNKVAAAAQNTTQDIAYRDMPPAGEEPGNVRPGVNPDEAARERFNRRKDWFLAEAYRQAPNRVRMAKCESYYDSEQWTYEDAQILRDRGQDPIVYNEIKPTIDWLIGTERRARIDFVVMAEDEGDEADDDAALKTKVLKYLDDTNQAAFERSWAAEDAFKAGIGWIEVGARREKGAAPVFVGAESWRNMLWDSIGSQRRDIQDGRFVFRIKVVDDDVALALFPDKREEISRCVQTGDVLQVFSEWMGGLGTLITGLDNFSPLSDPLDDVTARPVDMFNTRKRVMLLECWSKEPVQRKPGERGPLEFRMHVSIMTEFDTLLEAPSPYKHNRFPFIPVWAYRNRRTGLPYSPIWPLVGPQDGLNKRMSKSLFEANSNQVELEADAVDDEIMDINEIRAEYNDPNGMPVFRAGALQGNKVRQVQRGGAMQQQLELGNVDRLTIRSMSGVNGDNRGENSNVTSGKAVLAKQDQGSLLTAELFDNLLYARKMEGDLTLSVVEQFMVEPRTIRVAEGIGKGERIKVNQPQADGSYLNDLTARRAHFVVGEQSWKQAYAEAAFESLLQVLSQLATAAPQAVINLLDLVFDMHPTLPKKRAIVQRIRSINGQTDPDAKMTPQEEAEQQQKQAIAQAQFELQMSQMKAQVAEAQAKGQKLSADAMLTQITAIYEAAQAAQVLSALPTIAPIADELLRSVGMRDQPDPGQFIDQPTDAPLRPTGPDGQPVAAQAAPPGGAPDTQQIPPPQQGDGAAAGHLAGIHTPAPDGAHPGAQ